MESKMNNNPNQIKAKQILLPTVITHAYQLAET
jgi:hypothetical protein